MAWHLRALLVLAEDNEFPSQLPLLTPVPEALTPSAGLY